jgi:uncharacterized RDD family membrane protein YckC
MTKADHPADNSAATWPPAGMTRRAMATVLDMIVFCGLSVALLLPVSSGVEWASLPADFDQVAKTVSNQSWISHATGVLGIWIAMWWCYFVVGWGLVGATPGKLVLGLRVVDHHDRYPIGLSRALLRLVTYILSSATLGMGHWLIVLRADKCALHDILAGTKVVRRTKAVSPDTLGSKADSGERKAKSGKRKAESGNADQ